MGRKADDERPVADEKAGEREGVGGAEEAGGLAGAIEKIEEIGVGGGEAGDAEGDGLGAGGVVGEGRAP